MTGLPQEFVTLANRLADAAGAAIRPHFRVPIDIDDKEDESPVTIADRQAETAMREILEREVPAHGIFGEEYGKVRVDAEYVWVLDPIDGTKSFITGMPTFGTLVGLCRNGEPVLGIIDQPISGERWIGVKGPDGYARLDGKPVRSRACPDISRATMFTYGVECFEGPGGDAFARVREKIKLIRFSADCYAYGLLATGFIDLVMDTDLKPYDFCALAPIVEGAGGRITDWDGKPLTIHSGDRVLATGDARLHEAALSLIRG